MRHSNLKISGVVLAALLAAAPIVSTSTTAFADPNGGQGGNVSATSGEAGTSGSSATSGEAGTSGSSATSGEDNTSDASKIADASTVNKFVSHFSSKPLIFSRKAAAKYDPADLLNWSGLVDTYSGPGLVDGGDTGKVNDLAGFFYDAKNGKQDAINLWKQSGANNKFKSFVSFNGGDRVQATLRNASVLAADWNDVLQNGGNVKEEINFLDTDGNVRTDVRPIVLQVNVLSNDTAVNNFMNYFSTSPKNVTTDQLNKMGHNPLPLLNHSGVVGTYSTTTSGSAGEPNNDHFGLVDMGGGINGLAQYFYDTSTEANQTAVAMWEASDQYDLKSTIKYGDKTCEVNDNPVNEDKIDDLWDTLKQNGGDVKETLEILSKSDGQVVGTTTLTVHVTKGSTSTSSVSGGGSYYPAASDTWADTTDNDNDNNNTSAPTVSATVPVTGIMHIKSSNTILYTKDGKAIPSRVLPANTDWRTDTKVTLNDGRVLYRVATNEYVLGSAADFSENSVSVTPVSSGVFTVTQPGFITLQKLTDNNTFEPVPVRLIQNSSWKYDKKAVWNGQTYYRIATNEWVNATDGSLS
ncbi:SLAP domain-containing protein [Bombilactobacillus folatiphilus]|uniref:SLAP domain-containing protein n=1 Tax=Bombilactobacillus folatiphilus TaxID=2923362 RepID=A0ABY4PA48_9LACO|nr:SLAP domain-containing protein [Bombilactobacillus folatiphilus]UQS82272.1 SLAP domain-containing protein [Bombilactobacillus folatiphilus]